MRMATFIELDNICSEPFGRQISIKTGYFNIDEIISIIIQDRTITMSNERKYSITVESYERLRRILDNNESIAKDD